MKRATDRDREESEGVGDRKQTDLCKCNQFLDESYYEMCGHKGMLWGIGSAIL